MKRNRWFIAGSAAISLLTVGCNQRSGDKISQSSDGRTAVLAADPTTVTGSESGHTITYVDKGRTVKVETAVAASEPGTPRAISGKETAVAVRVFADETQVGVLAQGAMPKGWNPDAVASSSPDAGPAMTNAEATKLSIDILNSAKGISADERDAIGNLFGSIGYNPTESEQKGASLTYSGQWRSVAEVWYQPLYLLGIQFGHHSATRIFHQKDTGAGFVTMSTTTWCNWGDCAGSPNMTYDFACTGPAVREESALAPTAACATGYDLQSGGGGHNCHDDTALQVARVMDNVSYSTTLGDCNNGYQQGYVMSSCAEFQTHVHHRDINWPIDGGLNRVNRAIGKPATQSSTYQGNVASRAVDGNTDGNYGGGSLAHTNCDNPSWWQVDLQAQYLVNSIDVYNRTDGWSGRLSDAKIRISDDGINWTTTGKFGAAAPINTAWPMRAARFVRIEKNDCINIAEVMVYGDLATPDDNLALGKPATQSSTDGANVAARAVDGNTDGNYYSYSLAHTLNGSPSWWQVDLQAQYVLSSIEIYNRTDGFCDRINSAQILVSSDGSTWTNTGENINGMNCERSVHFRPVSATARYVRIQDNDYINIAEVKVRGYAADLTVENAGNTALIKDGSNRFYAKANPAGAAMPIRGGDGVQIYANIYGADWQTIAAENVGGENRVLWKNISSASLHIWHMDANWNFAWSSGSEIWPFASLAALNQEIDFKLDGDGNGSLGGLLEDVGNTVLLKDSSNYLYAKTGAGAPISIKFGGNPVPEGYFGSGWVVIAVENIGGENQVLFKNTQTNVLHFWHVDANWNWVYSDGQFSFNSIEAMMLQSKFF